MNKVFVVLKEGIYRHECCGVYSTDIIAVQAANKLANSDNDNYHAYIVIPFEVDNLPKVIRGYCNNVNEPDEIFRCSKGEK